MNWGNRIVVAFVLFAAFILYMVVRAFQQDFDLVADDYYAQEINYQQKLVQKANLENLVTKVLLVQGKESITMTFPEGHEPNGEVHFYHPSTELFDQKVPINTDAANQQEFGKDSLITGSYRINITWESDGKEYFQQEQVFIQ